MTSAHTAVRTAPQAMGVPRDEVWLGKDVLELVSTAMYVDSMNMYREYIQNAADGIDEARATSILDAGEPGRIEVHIDQSDRNIRIRDNGCGVPPDSFVGRMTALGGSVKRGTAARGFRGVGRLCGLAFAQELVFRSRTSGQPDISEIRWDCRQLKAALADRAFEGDVTDLIARIVSVARLPVGDTPEHFFEVELIRVIRQRNDKLMHPAAVGAYLSQVAPVPFSPEFKFSREIMAALTTAMPVGELDIRINGGEPVRRPHRNELDLGPSKPVSFEEITIVEVPRMDGGIAAIAWFLHHGYEGALPIETLIKGVRLRVGNLQVGDHTILEEMFPESRFNSWSVGEVHVFDPRIIPNGRRDHFEQNTHFASLVNHLIPSARDIAHRCRTNSARRSKLREFELAAEEVRGRIEILHQGGLDAAGRDAVALTAETSLMRMEKVVELDLLPPDVPDDRMRETIGRLRHELSTAMDDATPIPGPLGRMPAAERTMYERMFALIYECSTNRNAAKALIHRILMKLGAD